MKSRIIIAIVTTTTLLGCFDKKSDLPSESIFHDGLERSYILDLPESYDGAKPLPLVLNFHGACMDAASQKAAMNMSPLGNEHNFIVVYPQGSSENGNEDCLIWNSGPYLTETKATVDDLGFVEALLDELSVHYAIDQERIYATGFSNGGFMSYAVGCYLNDRIAAIAPVAGMMVDEAMDTSANADNPCQISHPMPVIHLHGTADTIVSVNLGEDAVSFWREANDTGEVNVHTESNGHSGTQIEHQSAVASDGIAVEFYKVHGGYHETFDNISYQGSNSTELIWEFFSRYDLSGLREH